MQQEGLYQRYNQSVKILFGFLFLAFGCMIYLLFRSKSLNIYIWCRSLGITDMVDSLRQSFYDYPISDFVRFNLPDGLYCTAYLLIMDAIWKNENGIVKRIVLFLVPLFAISSEIFQYFGWVRGTFDVLDLVCYSVPPLLYMAFYYIHNYNH